MTVRQSILVFHRCLGLAAAILLAILGLTGSIMAFESDIPHWLNPQLYYVGISTSPLPEQHLLSIVEQKFAPARVRSVEFLRHPNLARIMHLDNSLAVAINPYSGAVLGSWKGPRTSERLLGYVHQIHLRLAPDPRSMPGWSALGKLLVSWSGAFLCFLVPTGLILFWRNRRTTIKTNASWARVCFDLHHVVGVYSALFLLIAAFTGIMIGFDWGEKAIYSATHSSRPARQPSVQSDATTGAATLTADRAIHIALGTLPGTTVAGVFLPVESNGVYTVLLRVPEDTSESVHSNVVLDQYTGRVLQVRNILTDSLGYRVIRFNRSIHTGDVLGTPTRIIMSLSSLLLVVMVATGLAIWFRRRCSKEARCASQVTPTS